MAFLFLGVLGRFLGFLMPPTVSCWFHVWKLHITGHPHTSVQLLSAVFLQSVFHHLVQRQLFAQCKTLLFATAFAPVLARTVLAGLQCV